MIRSEDATVTDRPGTSPGRAAPVPGAARLFSPTSLALLRFVGVALLATGAATSSHATRTDQRVALGVLIGLVLAGYVGWTVAKRVGARRLAPLGLVVMALAGGGVGGLSGFGVGFVAVIAIGAGDLLQERTAAGLVGLSVASLALGVAITHGDVVLIGWAALAGAAGLAGGVSRRQSRLRAEQSEQLLAERERTASEAAHAAALEERNRIGREVHDVLAHSLSALAVQLDMLDALLGEGDVVRARQAAAASRRLAVEGLDETRRAVRALRGAPLDLVEQLRSLAAAGNASFRTDGVERPLPPEAALAVYRAAQEALTNARKHAPGARADVSLAFAGDRVALEVVDSYSNGTAPEPPAGGPPGYGLTGMRERVELLGGWVEAGPLERGNGSDGNGGAPLGWKVAVEVPLPATGDIPEPDR